MPRGNQTSKMVTLYRRHVASRIRPAIPSSGDFAMTGLNWAWEPNGMVAAS